MPSLGPTAALGRARLIVAAATFAALAAGSFTTAAQPPERPPDTMTETAAAARAQRIAAQLRCLVCQNQTIAESNAGLAVDLRRKVHEMVARGDSEQQVIEYMTARYGDFVLYRPPLRVSTALLWFGPGALLLLAVGVLYRVLRRRSRMPAEAFEPDPQDDTPAALGSIR